MKNGIYKNVVVFYRQLPGIINDTVVSDGHMSMVKDGVKTLSHGRSAPRITIKIQSLDLVKNEKRLKSLVKILENLSENNQIVTFKVM